MLTLSTAVLVLASCGEESPKQETVAFRVSTYNVGLAPIDVDYADERAPRVVQALAAEATDLFCVQEFWRQADWDALVAATGQTFPNVVRKPAEPVEARCLPNEFEPLQACAEDSCSGMAGNDLAECALSGCDAEVSALSPGCTDCLIDGVGEGWDIDGLRTSCLGGSGEGSGAGTEAFIYEGAYDTGILTNASIQAQESRALDSYLLRTAVDYALVDSPLGPLHVFCAHLASSIPQFDYRGQFGSWEGEQRHQIEQLLDFIDEKAGSDGAVVLMGDLNTGPAVASRGIESEWESNYAQILAAGFTEPWTAQADVACTDCPQNTFSNPESAPKLIDHILLRGVEASATAERRFTDPVPLTVGEQTLQSNLSDHFGLRLTLEGPKP